MKKYLFNILEKSYRADVEDGQLVHFFILIFVVLKLMLTLTGWFG